MDCDSWQSSDTTLVHVQQAGSSKQADVSAYMTGVVEVQLPMDYKIKNIEETEAAKKQMLGAARGSAFRYAGICMYHLTTRCRQGITSGHLRANILHLFRFHLHDDLDGLHGGL